MYDEIVDGHSTRGSCLAGSLRPGQGRCHWIVSCLANREYSSLWS